MQQAMKKLIYQLIHQTFNMKKKEENISLAVQPSTPPPPPKITLKDKINDVVDKHESKDELKKAIFDLVQRVQFPDQFCPECDDRLFLNGQTYECLNCGFSRQASVQPTFARPTTQSAPAQPRNPNAKVPEAVEKAIEMANENMADAPRRAVPGSRGAHIQKLVEKMGDSSVAPTPQDTEIIKSSDPNVRDVNWV